MDYFVEKDSIVRKIWGKSDTVLMIFAGAAAEFALNKAVDWLYFTGKLPSDPLNRLFSTVGYARKIIFAENTVALKTIDSIYSIHKGVEANRGRPIPDWAYRDVLFMLVHYSISSYEVLEKKLSLSQKAAVYEVFYRFGTRMKLADLPEDYSTWAVRREADMNQDLEKSVWTTDLFLQYKKHLGRFRYFILIEAQKLIVPARVRHLLNLRKASLLSILLPFYKMCRRLGLDSLIKKLLLPQKYEREIREIDMV